MIHIPRAVSSHRRFIVLGLAVATAVSGCAVFDHAPIRPGNETPGNASSTATLTVVNRITWGVNGSTIQQVAKMGLPRYVDEQLLTARALPAPIAGQIGAMTISRQPLDTLVRELEQRRKDADAIKEDEAKKIAQQAYQAELNRLAREAATRTLLRAVYSPNSCRSRWSGSG